MNQSTRQRAAQAGDISPCRQPAGSPDWPPGFKPERPHDVWYMRSYTRGWNQRAKGAERMPMPAMPGDPRGLDLI